MIIHSTNRYEDSMRTTVKGVLRNEPRPKSLIQPIFEAISNGIHAIEDNQENGVINIRCDYDEDYLRNHTVKGVTDNATARSSIPIKQIRISDNGIGFNFDNYESFQNVNSLYKFSRGGRGKGRFSWLKVFRSAHIESRFKDSDGYKARSFDFSVEFDPRGLGNEQLVSSLDTNTGTCVTLDQPIDDRVKIKLDDFSQRILLHFLPQFITKTIPQIIVEDSSTKINLNDEFKNLINFEPVISTQELQGIKFIIKHLLVKKISNTHKHQLYLCANKREVLTIDLKETIPLLPDNLYKNNDAYVYRAIVESDYLDQHVNADRSDFSLPEEDDCFGLPSLETIVKLAQNMASTYLAEWVVPEKEKSIQRIRMFINNEAPQYRGLLKTHLIELERINTNNYSELELDKALYALRARIEQENRGEYKNFTSLSKGDIDLEVVEKKYDALLERLDDSAKDGLASYVVNRKKIIAIFERLLQINASGKFPKEIDIHQLIFPVRKDSDEVPFKEHNLWLLDEKLVFHQYLASDKPLNRYDPINSNSDDRPDLAIYQNIYGFSETNTPGIKQSLTIVEFKRPGRDDYTASDNPIDQIMDYATKIRSSQCKDFYGRELQISESAPVYGYIVCDITQSLRSILNKRDFIPFPDAEGYYLYNRNMKLYIEVKNLSKILRDATQRHKSFFHELGVD